MFSKDYEKQIIDTQLKLLSNWNNENIDKHPEQVRLNTETICMLINQIHVIYDYYKSSN